MIITQNKSKKVVQSHDFNSVNCTIDAEDMRYVASLLRNNYSNTRLAVVREITCNALDANLEANSSRPIEVKLPNKMNPNFEVRDFGGGLSKEDVFGLYSKYGKSTKRTSNNYIGAFGIGKFAPLSYGDNFTCISYHGGIKRSYNIFVNEDDDTKIVELHKEPSNEPSGLSISVAVLDNDIDEFRNVVKEFFKFFPQEDMPKFIGAEDGFIKTPNKILASKNDDWFFVDESRNYYSRNSHVLMGRVAYPIDNNSINVSNFIQNESLAKIISQILAESNFYFRAPLGSLKLHHSREALEYNKTTQKTICSFLYKISKEIQEIAKAKLADSEDLWEAKRNYAKVINALPYTLRGVFENSFEWNGIKIGCSSFTRNYDLQDDIILTEYERIEDKSSRNGFKLKAQKVSRIYCQDNFLLMIQDLESSHGNNLRVRTLMNSLPDLKGVYIVNPISELGKNHIYDEWQFDLIDVKHKRYTSNVDKEKIIRNKVSGNESRASIPLFKMKSTKSSYAYRNADYWENVNEPINSLELDKIEGSVNGKIIYVPIKNYKVHDEEGNYDLDRVYKISRSIRNQAQDNSDEKTFVLFGVRAGDVKKLDKETWVSFFDFYVDICKKIITSNKKECQSAYNCLNFDSTNLLDKFRWSLGQLFQNKTFDISSLADDHILVKCKNHWNTFANPQTTDGRYKVAVNVVNKHDKEWLSDALTSSLDLESIEKEFDSLVENYPLVQVVSANINSYVNLKCDKRNSDRNTSKDLVDYISLCDDKTIKGEKGEL